MATARDRILDGIKNNGFYTTRTKAEAEAAKKLHSNGDIKSMHNVGSKTTANGKNYPLLHCE